MRQHHDDLELAWMKQDVRNGLLARLARTPSDIAAAQRLRYKVFFDELGAKATPDVETTERDADRFDALCDHVLIIDQRTMAYADGTELPEGRLVGTYRMLRHEVAIANGGFYTESEFDLKPLFQRHSRLRFLEVGRSCVAASHRGKPVAELLWQGIWDYVRQHRLDVMMGCASLPGTDPHALAHELSFLYHHARAPEDWNARALPQVGVPMNMVPQHDINAREVLHRLPILIKAYLRLGAVVGESACIDHAFNTTDVLILLPVSRINPKYFGHYGAPEGAPSVTS
jgi:L-ornithine Nalpha-acyltransferase